MPSASIFEESAFRETAPVSRASVTPSTSSVEDEAAWNRSLLASPAFWIGGAGCISFWSLLYVLLRSL